MDRRRQGAILEIRIETHERFERQRLLQRADGGDVIGPTSSLITCHLCALHTPSSQLRESVCAPTFATHAVVHKEQAIRVVLRFHSKQSRIVRTPE
jgi:hypothetical protein